MKVMKFNFSLLWPLWFRPAILNGRHWQSNEDGTRTKYKIKLKKKLIRTDNHSMVPILWKATREWSSIRALTLVKNSFSWLKQRIVAAPAFILRSDARLAPFESLPFWLIPWLLWCNKPAKINNFIIIILDWVMQELAHAKIYDYKIVWFC